MSDNLLALITTAVDGELSAVDRLRFDHLLDSSAEARSIYDKLKADSDRLRNLPHAVPPRNLHQRVMAQIAAVTPIPVTPFSRPIIQSLPVETSERVNDLKSSRSKRLVPIAIAASLLFAITGSSFWFFNGSGGKAGTVAHNSKRQSHTSQSGAGESEWAKWLPADNSSRPVAPTPNAISRADTRNDTNNTQSSVTPPVVVETITVAPSPRPARNPNIYAAEPRPDIGPLDLVRIRVPFLKPLADFDHEETRQQFVEELGRDPAFRIDVFTRHLPKSVDWFRNAAKVSNVNVAVDAATLDRVSKSQVSAVVVYIEAMTPSELADLFAKLCAEDAKITPRIFDTVHATPVVEDDQKALRSILGVDPGLFKRPAQEKGAENPKPISSGTVDQIVKSLSAGQGKETEKSAILMTWTPSMGRTIPSSSVELKQFLLKRGERKANALPVMIVIRHGNG